MSGHHVSRGTSCDPVWAGPSRSNDPAGAGRSRSVLVSTRRPRPEGKKVMATRDEICATCDQYVALLSKGDTEGIVALYDPERPGRGPARHRRRRTVTTRSASSTPESPG